MHKRDKVFLLAGVITGLFGVVVTLAWSLEAGIVTLLLLNLLNLVILILQRRQLGRIQQRTLALIKSREAADSTPRVQNLDTSKLQQDLKISNKRIVGLLQAHQTNLDLLNDKLDAVVENSSAHHEPKR